MTQKTLVIHPHFKERPAADVRSPEACLEEAVGLAHAIDLDVVDSIIVPLSAAKSASLFGSGKVEELAEHVSAGEIKLAIVNHSLSPVQQRNLEKAFNCKVIDRTGLILEIFGARARTHEGKLQVELASLNYQKSRLVRSWTHLERQRGGFGFLGGPGESQIEIDRRLIRDRISKIKKQLEQVTRTRNLHRKHRRDVPYPIVALVGYTNAGKSTLFNKLTGASVLSMDKLFATLDPTMRGLELPTGRVILSDTVGFVSDLPTELVAAFRATLEEVLEADVLLHVRDISHEDTGAQKRDVEAVLRSLFSTDSLPENVIEVCNKCDLLPSPSGRGQGEGLSDTDGSPHPNLLPNGEGVLRVSAVTGDGLPALLLAIEKEMAHSFFIPTRYTLDAADGKPLAWLHANGKVVALEPEDEYIHVDVCLSQENLRRFERLYGKEKTA
ncbi:MAG: GTPase HflX [Alphaproteobacteria bacterium]|nr:GTPase HflX [Alphaproteobacteria bacterium]